ncbi:MAG TPA: heavy metal-binding domain-containing protein [Opitutaceae bacterium]|nr:heavy metal-binding domain-containing protein [Opitutaceae bacterium]
MNTTGLSGNEIYCVDLLGYRPGDIVMGNSVHALGALRGIGSGFRAIAGGEITQFTELIEEGRAAALGRLEEEAKHRGAVGITGVTSEIVFHGTNIEFLSIGSAIHSKDAAGAREDLRFSTSADGQDLFVQEDAGYEPLKFVFGNVAYSIGITSGIIGAFKTLARGEVREFSDIFNVTRHLALERITKEARAAGANAIVGIETTILPFGMSGVKEMLMIGTASKNPGLGVNEIVSTDLTPQEMWNLNQIGYTPVKLVLGTSVYSLGLMGGITSALKSFVRGEIPELSSLLYEARENALRMVTDEAKRIGADEVVGVKTYVYQLGSGLIEFMAIGTAVRRTAGAKNKSANLPPQAFSQDWDTFVDAADANFGVNLNKNGR